MADVLQSNANASIEAITIAIDLHDHHGGTRQEVYFSISPVERHQALCSCGRAARLRDESASGSHKFRRAEKSRETLAMHHPALCRCSKCESYTLNAVYRPNAAAASVPFLPQTHQKFGTIAVNRMPPKKLTRKRLDVITIGRANGKQQFHLASLQADGETNERSRKTDWSLHKYERLASWLARQTDVPRFAAELNELLRQASKELGHGNATAEGRARAKRARTLGPGSWRGTLPVSELMGRTGCFVVRGLVDPADCETLLEEAQRLFDSEWLHSSKKAQKKGRKPALRGVMVHAASPGGKATLHSLARAALQDELSAEAREAWHRAVEAVAGRAGHDATLSSDEALNVCAQHMAAQELG